MPINRVRIVGISVVLSAYCLLGGCRSTTTIDEYTDKPSSLSSGDALVVLGRRHELDRDTERDFITCVGEKIGDEANHLTVIPESEFVDNLYPWFETSTAPMEVSRLDDLFKNPVVAQKFTELNLRYFIWINGFTETTNSNGALSCTVGPGGGGCFGFKSWDDAANYEASVWDLNERRLAARINTETEGTSYVPAVIVPIPLLARVKATACSAMSDRLLNSIGIQSPNVH